MFDFQLCFNSRINWRVVIYRNVIPFIYWKKYINNIVIKRLICLVFFTLNFSILSLRLSQNFIDISQLLRCIFFFLKIWRKKRRKREEVRVCLTIYGEILRQGERIYTYFRREWKIRDGTGSSLCFDKNEQRTKIRKIFSPYFAIARRVWWHVGLCTFAYCYMRFRHCAL